MTLIPQIFKYFAKYNFVKMELRGDIPEEQERRLFPFLGGRRSLSFGEIEKVLTALEDEDDIAGVILIMSELGIGLGRANSLRTRLMNLKTKGKRVFVYLESGGNVEYLIATAGEQVFLPPWSMLNLIGLSAEVTFFRETLDKLGIVAQMKGFGEYKSAAETFTRDSMSGPHREMIDSIIGDLEAQVEDCIAEGRGIKRQDVKSLIDCGPFVPDWALQSGLIDGICYENELENEIGEITGMKVHAVSAHRVHKMLKIKEKVSSFIGRITGKGGIIAVVADTGIITLGESRGSGAMKTMGSNSLLNLLEGVTRDKRVKALVLRILTPGGSGVASDLIRKKIKLISEGIPVVVSMSDVAASGGYMIALAAKTIVTDSMSLTGSIGIVSGKFNLKDFYEKIGVKKEWVSYGKNSRMFTFSKGFSEEEEKRLEEIMRFYYKGFVEEVSRGRGMGPRDAEKAAKGRVWTGRQAKELGLVDKLGGIWDAVGIAKTEAGLTEDAAYVKFYSEDKGIQLSSLFKASAYLETVGELVDTINALGNEGALAIMPYYIDIK